MRYFSIVAFAKGELDLPEHKVNLDSGMNVFSVYVDDVDSLVEHLQSQGVTVQSVHALDQFESVPPPPNEDPLEITAGEG